MEKPTVTYTDALTTPCVGYGAHIQVLDHPHHAPRAWVLTSNVVSIEGAKFETRSTRYVPGLTDPVPETLTATAENI